MESNSTVSKLDFLIDEERELFRIAEERSKTHDAEAAGAVTGAIAFGAAIFAGFSGSDVSPALMIGFAAVGVCLAVTIAAGFLARRHPEPLIRAGKYAKGQVAKYDAAVRAEDHAVRALRTLALDVPVETLRHRSLDLWRARTVRVHLAVAPKRHTTAISLSALYFALAIIAIMGWIWVVYRI